MTETWPAALETLKAALGACALPPVPLLLLALFGAWRAHTGRRSGVTLVALACTGLWLASCNGMADRLERMLLAEPPALNATDRDALRRDAEGGRVIAIVVLGGGLDREAPEYGGAGLPFLPLERLRYGAWLSRETGIPLAVSGGVGWASPQPTGAGVRLPAEADVMADIAARDFGRPPRWREGASRDTHENAANSIALLAPQGVQEIVLVTHAWHMPRALRQFRAAAAARVPAGGSPLVIRPAPMGFAAPADRPLLDWLPSGTGALRVRAVLREALASLVGH